MNSAKNSVPEIDVGGGLSPPAAADRADGAGSTVKYHGMYVAYVAGDALVKLLGMRAENARSCAECLLR